jgi:hypothetical protein
MNTYTEFLEKAQSEFLTGLKQAQELNLKTLASVTSLLSSVPAMPVVDGDVASSLPTATDVVERTFAFTSELIETRKAYALKLAELAGEAQKQFADTTKRFVEAAKN